MQFLKLNLHIHSNFSDGKQTIRQIIEKSIKLDLDYIAITDHFTDSWKAWVSNLNTHQTISEYIQELSKCQRFLIKNHFNLKLLIGLEIDLESSMQFIKTYIKIDEFDIILLEYLQNYETIAFVKNIIDYWNKKLGNTKKLPILGLAHFDPSYFMLGNLGLLMDFLKEYNIFFEFNSSYPIYYSTRYERFFDMLREFKVPVGIGCDSHNNRNLDNFEEPFEMIKYYNLESNLQILIEMLKKKKINKFE
ncbi:MAG: PHP domain-containing protein [Promethearchaeota archaeon]